jgi:multicomponent Na+:H+ antiporter subunit B
LKKLGLVTVILCGILLLIKTADFSNWGDPNSPASQHLSPYYLENSIKDSAVPNVVTAVLADYRGFDTMFETTVILAAGLACFFILRIRKTEKPKSTYYRHVPTATTLRITDGSVLPEQSKEFKRIDSVWIPFDLILATTCKAIIPFIQIFGLYVIAHGHHSPGGGFQGGVILGASIILMAISRNLGAAIRHMKEKTTVLMAMAGVLIYAGTGAFAMLAGKNFLDYSTLASVLGVDKVMARSHGILIVETGVALAVMAVMVWIYYNLSSAGKQDEGL